MGVAKNAGIRKPPERSPTTGENIGEQRANMFQTKPNVEHSLNKR